MLCLIFKTQEQLVNISSVLRILSHCTVAISLMNENLLSVRFNSTPVRKVF